MNRLGTEGEPFLFIIDFEGNAPVVLPLQEAESQGIYYDCRGKTNVKNGAIRNLQPLIFEKIPIDYHTYLNAFEIVKEGLTFGNSYLLNLTFPTRISINRSLKEIFHLSQAPYKLLFRDEFTVFSPECFVRIDTDGVISSFPMKGTIDASLQDAAELLLNDPKEMAEHNTIVDLIRNDLTMVAGEVRVKRFRYLEEIKTNQKHLLQASSEIAGQLPGNWRGRTGDILQTLLPAGSISGAPKKKTLEIIRQAELTGRGYYTGVFGLFDGSTLDSAVMIRFIEQKAGEMIFRSGGGITVNSQPETEYREMIDKVYVPFV
ncbi:MAG: aminodeoxychorismate synthase component I [Lentimicrobium sp.]